MMEALLSFLYPSRCYLCIKGEPESGYTLCTSCIRAMPQSSGKCGRCGYDPCKCDWLKYRGRITIGYDWDIDPRILLSDHAMADLFMQWHRASSIRKIHPFTKKDAGICSIIQKRLSKEGYIDCGFTKALDTMGQSTMHIRAHTPQFYSFIDRR